MVEVVYVGETLWAKNIGHFLLILSFFASILAVYAYFVSNKTKNNSWRNIGNIAFTVKGVSMISVIIMIFTMMIQKNYEYSYVQAHVSDDLPFQYIFSAFWEGQEGSFLLWIFWHIILGWVIMLNPSKWTAPVMGFLSLIQVFILSMILGIHFEFGDYVYKLGSNPLTLLRETMDIPLFANAEYVSLLKGTGLNPLLQNYWMTIHPPTLFLGFASVSIPFCFAAAGLLNKDHRDWLKPALPWALFSAAILGIGILMGAAWAYEALSFGGYWAWDPVENSSLVPWITLVAGVHTNLIARNTKYSVKSTYWFYLLSFILIVYSTTLTRSGVLGDTSVHAFTEMGLEAQLFAFISFFILGSLFLYFRALKSIPKPEKEEHITSREFWMFIGALILLFSAIMITFSTSLPLFNKLIQIFDPEFTSMVLNNPIEHYNKLQIWIGVFVALLSGMAQFLRYKERGTKYFYNKSIKYIGFSALGALGATYLVNLWLDMQGFQFFILLFSGLFSILANLTYFIAVVKAQPKMLASVMSHTGFGIMLIGILATGLNQRHISINKFLFSGVMDEERVGKNVQLIKERPIFMSDYWVTYEGDTVIGQNRYFDINFKKLDENKNVLEDFTLSPNALYANDFSKIAAFNPATKHYWFKDIFTHIAGLPSAQIDSKFAQEMEDTMKYELHSIPLNSWQNINHYKIKVSDFSQEVSHREYHSELGDVAFQVKVEVQDTFGKTHIATPAVALRSTVIYKFYDQVDDVKSRFRINEASFENLIKADFQLEYDKFTMNVGETASVGGLDVKFEKIAQIDAGTIHEIKDDDIAVKAILNVTNQNGDQKTLEPKFIIRNKKIIPIRDVWMEENLYAIFNSVNPETGSIDLLLAQSESDGNNITLEVAKDIPRGDVIVLEAIVFPGINFFWLGSSIMLLGLALAMGLRLAKK